MTIFFVFLLAAAVIYLLAWDVDSGADLIRDQEPHFSFSKTCGILYAEQETRTWTR